MAKGTADKSQKLMAKLEKMDLDNLKAGTTQEQIKAAYAGIRVLLELIAGLPFVPSKYVNLIRMFISLADKVLV